jgi:hypothetical protein
VAAPPTAPSVPPISAPVAAPRPPPAIPPMAAPVPAPNKPPPIGAGPDHTDLCQPTSPPPIPGQMRRSKLTFSLRFLFPPHGGPHVRLTQLEPNKSLSWRVAPKGFHRKVPSVSRESRCRNRLQRMRSRCGSPGNFLTLIPCRGIHNMRPAIYGYKYSDYYSSW